MRRRVLGRGRGAEGRDRIRDTRMMQANGIHIAFDDQQALEVGTGAAGFVQRVELASLVEENRLRRVEIFRLAAVDDAAAERDHAAARVPDGEHDAIAKAVVVPVAFTH